ncbi:MAG: chromosomal replication initiator protein DnaA [bacterium]|nr:chromosomal replication initiator protein DnaA [bacterium]
MPAVVDRGIWREVLRRTRDEIGVQEFNTWLRATKLKDGNNGNYVVEVPNEVYKDFVESNYLPLLESSLSDLTAAPAAITISASPEQGDLFGVSESAVLTGRPAKEYESKTRTRPSNLNENYSFKSFVIGRSNSFCAAAARAVAEKPGETYNPFFIYGNVGLGKTHLLQAIGHLALEQDKSLRVAYLSADQFMNEMIEAIKENRPEDFRRKYRRVDVLLVDDIHFWAGREGTQEEFFHTFNALYQRGKQIAISCDRLPKDLSRFEERLRTRFEWGLIADIQAPDYEMRVAIIEKKLEERGIEVGRNIVDVIASTITTNIRAIEGVIIRLEAIQKLKGGYIDAETTRRIITELVTAQNKPISIEQIQDLTADYFGISKRDLVSKSRRALLAKARHVAIYLCREKGKSILADIGAAFGNRDHTTIINSLKVIESSLKNGENELKNAVNDLSKKLEMTN